MIILYLVFWWLGYCDFRVIPEPKQRKILLLLRVRWRSGF